MMAMVVMMMMKPGPNSQAPAIIVNWSYDNNRSAVHKPPASPETNAMLTGRRKGCVTWGRWKGKRRQEQVHGQWPTVCLLCREKTKKSWRSFRKKKGPSNKKQIKPQQAGLHVCRPVLVGSHWEPRFSDRLSYRKMAGIITGDNRYKNRIDGSHLGQNQVSLLFFNLENQVSSMRKLNPGFHVRLGLVGRLG